MAKMYTFGGKKNLNLSRIVFIVAGKTFLLCVSNWKPFEVLFFLLEKQG